MKQITALVLFLFLNLNFAFSQCLSNPVYLGDTLGFHSNYNCALTPFTFASITDTVVDFFLSPPTQTLVTYYLDAFRIESIQGVPAGLVISTDVLGSADLDGPFGYWFNGGAIPSQTPMVGCLAFSGDANLIASLATGGPNNDGIYPLVIYLDMRIGGTFPEIPFIIPNGTWSSELPANIGGGLIPYQVSLHVGSGITSTVIVSGASCVTGSADITLSGASLPITYSLDNSNPITTPINTISLINLGIGAHNVSGSDDDGCFFSEDFQTEGIQPYQQEAVCVVTVDSITGENLVVWEKTLGVYTDGFNIYKQNGITSQYDNIGWVGIGSLSTFLDAGSNPQQGSDRYKISVVDDCGVESFTSAAHRTIHLSANQGINGEVNLSWNAYEGFSYPNFEIYRSNDGNPYVLINNVANNNFTYTDLTPPIGVNYYRVAVVNPNGCNPTRSVVRSYSNIINDTGQPVSVQEEVSVDFSVYPNPSSGIFNIMNEDIQGLVTYTVLDVRGREVLNGSFVSNGGHTEVLDLSTSTDGVYTVRLNTSNGVATQKLVKE